MVTITGKRVIYFSITCLGMSSLITQIVSLREFMSVLAGNELVLGVILGNWLLLTGMGTYCGRWSSRFQKPIVWLVFIQITLAFLPLLQITFIRSLKSFFLPGLMLGLNQAFLVSSLILSLYCILSGFLLTFYSGLGGYRRDARQIGEVYVVDVIGDILGGILFSFFLVYFLSSYQTLIVLLYVNLLAASLVCHVFFSRKAVLGICSLVVLSSGLIFAVDVDLKMIQAMFPGQQIISHTSTPYNQLVATEKENQVAVYANGIVYGSTENIIAAEESVHYGLSQLRDPESVLLVSGGLDGSLFEAAKYPVQKIDYVELDPAAIVLVQEFALPGQEERIRFIATDARQFIRAKNNLYDAVLLNLADPSTAQLNRFYTIEFFREVKNALRKDGVLSLRLSAAENYADEEISFLAAAVYNSLAKVFSNILIIPGENQFYVAADKPLDYNIPALLKKQNIGASFVTTEYLQSKLTRDRIDAAHAMVSSANTMNEDFKPAGYYMLIRYWLAQFQTSLLLPILVMSCLILGGLYVLLATPGKSTALAVGTSGFAGLGLEVVLIIVFQVCFGYVYQQMGVIITGFLFGTAVGGAWSVRSGLAPRAMMIRMDLLLAFAALGLAILLPEVKDSVGSLSGKFIPSLIFGGLTTLIGFLVGAQFPAAARLVFQKVESTAGNLYTLDYLGAALGGLVIATFAIPVLGISNTCFLLGGIKLGSSCLLWFHRDEKVKTLAVEQNVHGVGAFPAVLSVFLFAALGYAIYSDPTSTTLYSVSFLPYYHWFLFLLVVINLLHAMELRAGRLTTGMVKQISHKVFHHTWIRLFRWVNYVGFMLVAFFPLFRCYFKVPYLFCHVCPRQCVFGYLRPYLIPAILIMNLEKRYWCIHSCPLGTMFDCQAQAVGGARRVPKYVRWPLAGGIFLFAIYSYFRLKSDLGKEVGAFDDWYTIFFANMYAPSITVIFIAALFVLLSFWLRRPFCDCCCPVGAVSELFIRAEQKLVEEPTKGLDQEIAS